MKEFIKYWWVQYGKILAIVAVVIAVFSALGYITLHDTEAIPYFVVMFISIFLLTILLVLNMRVAQKKDDDLNNKWVARQKISLTKQTQYKNRLIAALENSIKALGRDDGDKSYNELLALGLYLRTFFNYREWEENAERFERISK